MLQTHVGFEGKAPPSCICVVFRVDSLMLLKATPRLLSPCNTVSWAALCLCLAFWFSFISQVKVNPTS